MHRLRIQVGQAAPESVEIRRRCRAGGGAGDEVRIAGLPEGTLQLAPTEDGLLIQPRGAFEVDGRALPAGTRRLLREGERAAGEGWAAWAELVPPTADGTRSLLAAALSGLPIAGPGGPGVLVLEGPAAGRRFALAGSATVGRGAGADVPLDDPLASRRHVRLDLRGGAVRVRDLGSKNGTTVRIGAGARARERRAGRRAIRLRSGDRIAVGRTLLLYEELVATAPRCRRAPRSPGRLGRILTVTAASAALLALAALLARAAG